MKERFINIIDSMSEEEVKEFIMEFIDRDLDSSINDEAYYKILDLCREIEKEL